jgi:uncharacterized protein YndB with AHSA1/START domain
MSVVTCPTDVVAAPPERIWEQLTQPARLALWSGSTLVKAPGRPLAAGDEVVLAPGLGLRAVLKVIATEPPRELRVDVRLPLGVVNHEVIQIAPMDSTRCRVTFN